MFLPCINKHDDDDDDDDDKLSLCRPSFKYLSHPWGEEWSCNIHSMVLHGASNQDKLSLCRPSPLFLSTSSIHGGEGLEL